MKLHHTENVVKFSCNFCSYASKRKDDIRKHMHVHDNQKQMHECDICHKEYNYIETLRRHMKAEHRGDKFKWSIGHSKRKAQKLAKAAISLTETQNPADPPNLFDFIDESHPITTFKSKSRNMHPHRRAGCGGLTNSS